MRSPVEQPASSSPSPTSFSLREASGVVPLVTMQLQLEPPTRCSTAGHNQAALVHVPAATSMASPMASQTSSPPPCAAASVPVVTLEFPPATLTRCLTLGLYQAAHVLESATTTSALPSASSTAMHPVSGRLPRRPNHHQQASQGDAQQVFDVWS